MTKKERKGNKESKRKERKSNPARITSNVDAFHAGFRVLLLIERTSVKSGEYLVERSCHLG